MQIPQDFEQLHSWDLTIPEARALQESLRERLVRTLPRGFDPVLAAGADVSAARRSPLATAGFAVIDIATREAVAQSAVTRPVIFPYVPGYLTFRELPVLTEAWQRLDVAPDVVIFDGHGYAHPRRFGLACHGGVLFDIPSIGCAKALLVGTHGPLPAHRGATAPIEHEGEVVGLAVRTRTGVTPVYVSIGHLMDLPTAVDLVLRLSRFREPETTRCAHRLVNEVRRRDA